MKSIKVLVIQTALMPKSIYMETENESRVEVCENFEDIFALLKDLNITKDTQIYVNRGPGSYSGIRTGISYVMGLIHGGLIKKESVQSYTSFDLIRAAESEKDLTIPIYMKSWPRMMNGKLTESKGYFQEGKDILHVTYESIKAKADLLIYTEETELKEKDLSSDSGHQTSQLVEDVETYSKLVNSANFSEKLEPLYVNPVNITKRK